MSEAIKQDNEQKYNIGKKYLRAKEVSVYLGIALSTVWYYSKRGLITPKHLSKRVTVFELAEIDKLFENSEVA